MRCLTLLFAGDYAPCKEFEPLVRQNQNEIFGELKQDIKSRDLALLNLEAPLCKNGNPKKKRSKYPRTS